MITGPWRSIPWGVDKTRALLGGQGQPTRIRFAKSLLREEAGRERGIVKDLAAYRYPEVKDGRPITDLPLKDGVTDHSNDSLRYFGVGMWLSNPHLRALAPELATKAQPGWRTAA